MADGVALSVQASQDPMNNSVKHPETVQELYYSMRYCLPPAVHFQNDVRNLKLVY